MLPCLPHRGQRTGAHAHRHGICGGLPHRLHGARGCLALWVEVPWRCGRPRAHGGVQVSLSSTSGLAGTAVTDSAGRFSIPVTAASAGAPSPSAQDLSGAFLSLTANNRTCVDAATRLPLAVSLGALLPQYGDGAPLLACQCAVQALRCCGPDQAAACRRDRAHRGGARRNHASLLREAQRQRRPGAACLLLAAHERQRLRAVLTRSTGVQIRPYQAFIGGQDFKASGFYSVVGPLMGVPDASRFATEDLIAETTVCGPLLCDPWSRAASPHFTINMPVSSTARHRPGAATRWQARR